MVHSPVVPDNRYSSTLLYSLLKIPGRLTSTNSTKKIIPIVTRAMAKRKRGQPELELGKHGTIVDGDI